MRRRHRALIAIRSIPPIEAPPQLPEQNSSPKFDAEKVWSRLASDTEAGKMELPTLPNWNGRPLPDQNSLSLQPLIEDSLPQDDDPADWRQRPKFLANWRAD